MYGRLVTRWTGVVRAHSAAAWLYCLVESTKPIYLPPHLGGLCPSRIAGEETQENSGFECLRAGAISGGGLIYIALSDVSVFIGYFGVGLFAPIKSEAIYKFSEPTREPSGVAKRLD